MFHKTR